MKKQNYLIFLVLFSFFTVKVQNILTVDQNGGGGFLTINEAVNAAVSGDTIKIFPVVYISGVINNKPNVTLNYDDAKK